LESNFSGRYLRKSDITQQALYSYRTLEERIPEAHPLRKLHLLVDGFLQSMSPESQALYARHAPSLKSSRSPPTQLGRRQVAKRAAHC
jgi:hypothetical protein